MQTWDELTDSENMNQTFDIKYGKDEMNEIHFQTPDKSEGFFALSLVALDDIKVHMKWRKDKGIEPDKWRFEHISGIKSQYKYTF